MSMWSQASGDYGMTSMEADPGRHPEPYSERVRLASIIDDARSALAEPYDNSRAGLAARTGRLEALLQMLADCAETVASDSRG